MLGHAVPSAAMLAGGSSGTVGVLRLNNSNSSGNVAAAAAAAELSVSAAAAAAAADKAVSWQDDPHVAQLVCYGYPPDHAMHQLQQARGDLLLALYALQQQLKTGIAGSGVTGDSSAADGAPTFATAAAAAESLPQEWCDEVEVLSAIYGTELDSNTAGVLTLSIQSDQVCSQRP